MADTISDMLSTRHSDKLSTLLSDMPSKRLSDKLYARPAFPKRVVVTGGMPYGNKPLHFAHIGGYFVHADAFARFMRDRIGARNVIFVSGTDCYGSPLAEDYRKRVESGEYKGSIGQLAHENHAGQKKTLDSYKISLDLFAGSSIEPAATRHRTMSEFIVQSLYGNGHLIKLKNAQFYDAARGVFLNGRQVTGRCPVEGCQSEKGYADECDLGHQYLPSELIEPRSALSGEAPVLRDVENWYVDMEKFRGLMREWVGDFEKRPSSRPFVVTAIKEYLEPPVIYLKREYLEQLPQLKGLPEYGLADDGKSTSVKLIFKGLAEREAACGVLSACGMRYRTGKTIVPFRLTGNIDWGVPAPALEGLEGLTLWVWPESLWAPISFTDEYLCADGAPEGEWKKWWADPESSVYQFIGQDNIYFYGPAQTAIFLGMRGAAPEYAPPCATTDTTACAPAHDPTPEPPLEPPHAPPCEPGAAGVALSLTNLVVSNHILFLNKKASSSGKVKPPMADELLEYYTPEQLRAHFLGLGLGLRSVSFSPKPLNPGAPEQEADPVLKEGNLFTNVLNRIARSCFYTAQKYYDGAHPDAGPSQEALDAAAEAALDYEALMARCEFHQVMNLLDIYIRDINKAWAKNMKDADAADAAIDTAGNAGGAGSGAAGSAGGAELRCRTLADTLHMLRVAAVLAHPISPDGAEMIAGYLLPECAPDVFFCWDNIFKTLAELAPDIKTLRFKFLEPRIDFFTKHESQYN